MDAHQRIEQLNDRAALDPLAAALEQRIPDALRSGPARDALSGAAIGHALHPTLTDLPIGTWTSATLLDLLGARRWRSASATLTGIGLVAAVPTVASGLVEWGNTPPAQRRVAALHASFNGVAAGCYLVSLLAKVRGRTGLGVGSALLGALALSAGGALGAHLSLGRGVGVGDRSRGETTGTVERTIDLTDEGAAVPPGPPTPPLATGTSPTKENG